MRVGVTVFEDNRGNKFYNLEANIGKTKDAQRTHRKDEGNASFGGTGEPTRETDVGSDDGDVNLIIKDADSPKR
jgi:hypothetical protein